jgi:hypothetical protein
MRGKEATRVSRDEWVLYWIFNATFTLMIRMKRQDSKLRMQMMTWSLFGHTCMTLMTGQLTHLAMIIALQLVAPPPFPSSYPRSSCLLGYFRIVKI